MGTSEGASKGWTEERRARQKETLRKQRSTPEWRAAQAERTRQQWVGADQRRADLSARRKAEVTDPTERFLSHMGEPNEEGCIPWQSTLVQGYAKFSLTSADQVFAGKWLWRQSRELPDGWVLDHLCHTHNDECLGGVTCPHRACVNLDHLEPVTQTENLQRMNRRLDRLGLRRERDASGRFAGGDAL